MALTISSKQLHGCPTKPNGGPFALADPCKWVALEGFFMTEFHHLRPGGGETCGTVSGIREDRGFPLGPSSTVSLFLRHRAAHTKPDGGLQ